jgi:hypothetical protein
MASKGNKFILEKFISNNQLQKAQDGVETWKKQQALVAKEKAGKLKELLETPLVFKTKEEKLAEKMQQERYRIIPKDNTVVRNYNNVAKHSNVARNKTDKEIADERKAVRKKSDANVLNQYSTELFDGDNWTRENLAEGAQGLESKFRVSDEPNFFDDWLNPANMIGNMASNLGQAPLQAQQSDSYLPYITAIGTPLTVGALAGLGTSSNAQFINNLTNPIAGFETSIGNFAKSNFNKLKQIGKRTFTPSREVDLSGIERLSGQLRESNVEANLIEKVGNDINFSHQDYMLNKYPDVPVTENYINLIENQELNEINKNRITDLAEHWVYENPAQRVENQKIMEQLDPLLEQQRQEAYGIFNMSRKNKLDHVNERIKIIQNDAETIQNNIDVGANKFIEKLQNKAKDDPNFINELLEQRKQLEEAITKYGDEFFGDTKNPNFNNLTEEELNAAHLEIKAKRDNLRNEIQGVRDQVTPAKLNPAFEEKIKDLYMYAEEPIPASINDVFPVEKGMRERNRVVYPRAIPESVSDLNKYELDKLLDTQKTASGVNQGSYGNTISFGENSYSFEDLKALYDVNYEKAPFKLSEPSTWFGKKMNRVVDNKPSEFVKNIKIRDVDPEKLFHTIGHEVGHDFQKFGSWGELIAKYFDNIEYFSNHGENNLSRAFKKHMVEPNGWDSSSAWRSSGNELHSDLVAERFKIIDKLDPDPKKAVEMFRANEDAFTEQIVESGVLDKFFKPDTPLNIKKELAKILPVAVPAALTVGATVGAKNQNESEQMPTQKYGGNQSHFNFEKYAMKEMGGMMYANKDAGLPHEQSMRKYLSAQNNLLDFMKRVKVVGGPVPFDEYYRENIINPRNKS